MSRDLVVGATGGIAFEDGADRGRVLVFGHQTSGRYSLMTFTLTPRPVGAAPDFGPRLHRQIEETFLIRSGRLMFLLGEETFELGPGDFVRVPAGMRHGFANVSASEVEMLVAFHPGGFEELFITHRSDQHPPPAPDGFIGEARRRFGSEFETG